MENSELFEIVRAEIEQRGPMPFPRFMKLALYHPEHGYYSSGRASIGRRGDFFTNVSVGPLFGKLLAAQFLEIWEKLGRPSEFIVIEQGAHDGAFAADVLNALRESSAQCFAATSYVILEPFPIWRQRQQQTLHEFNGKVFWRESIDDQAPFTGIHFSNELFDSLPVHLIVSAGVARGATDWKEKVVTVAGNSFGFKTADLSRTDFHLDRLGFFPAGFETEVNVVASELMRNVAAKLSCGVILTIDYGFVRTAFYSVDRGQGSLQVRAQHKKLSSTFEQIGRADISAHVEWTALAEAALSAEANPIGFTDQHHFLTGIVSRFFPKVEFSTSEKRSLQTLLHPEMLGRNFQVLALGKNFAEKLSGFQFARNVTSELGV